MMGFSGFLFGLFAFLQLVAVVVVVVIFLKLFHRFVVAVEKIAKK